MPQQLPVAQRPDMCRLTDDDVETLYQAALAMKDKPLSPRSPRVPLIKSLSELRKEPDSR